MKRNLPKVIVVSSLAAICAAIVLTLPSKNKHDLENVQKDERKIPSQPKIDISSIESGENDKKSNTLEQVTELSVRINDTQPSVGEKLILKVKNLIKEGEDLEELYGHFAEHVKHLSLAELEALLSAAESFKSEHPVHYLHALEAIHEAIFIQKPAMALNSLLHYELKALAPALTGYYHIWSETDPDSAFQHLLTASTSSNTYNHDDAFQGIAFGALSAGRFDLLAQSIKSIVDANHRTIVYDMVFEKMIASSELDFVEDYVNTLEGEQRAMGELRLHEIYGRSNPEEALSAISAEHYPEFYQTSARNGVFESWAKHSPIDAAKWLEGQAFPDADLSAMLLILIRSWAQQSEPEVLAWIEKFEADPVFENAFQHLASQQL